MTLTPEQEAHYASTPPLLMGAEALTARIFQDWPGHPASAALGMLFTVAIASTIDPEWLPELAAVIKQHVYPAVWTETEQRAIALVETSRAAAAMLKE